MLFVSQAVVLRNVFEVEPLEEEGRERRKPSLVAFNHVSLDTGNADTFPILICRDHGQS